MEFRLSDGLAEIAPDEADTIVCAGMGGDLIVDWENGERGRLGPINAERVSASPG